MQQGPDIWPLRRGAAAIWHRGTGLDWHGRREYVRSGGEIGTGAFADQDFGDPVQEIKERIYEAAQDLQNGVACVIRLLSIAGCWN